MAAAIATIISLEEQSLALSSGIPAASFTRWQLSPHALPCSSWGLPSRSRCRERGGLLPHRFTLTALSNGGLISVALSVTAIIHGAQVLPGSPAHGARTFLELVLHCN
jgi:hypothetical protein